MLLSRLYKIEKKKEKKRTETEKLENEIIFVQQHWHYVGLQIISLPIYTEKIEQQYIRNGTL